MRTVYDRARGRLAALGVILFAYFALYPDDLAALLRPAERILGLSGAIAPGLYAVMGVAILAWAAVRIWGRAAPVAPPRESGPG